MNTDKKLLLVLKVLFGNVFLKIFNTLSYMKYAVIIEKGEKNYSAYIPDLPGCVSTGDTIEEIKKNILEAVEFHIQGMKEDGEPIPKPTTLSDYIEVAA